MDDVYGDLNGRCSCSVPPTLPPGETYSCSFEAFVGGESGELHRDVVTASGTSDDDGSVSGAAGIIVGIVASLNRIPVLGGLGVVLLTLLLGLGGVRRLGRE